MRGRRYNPFIILALCMLTVLGCKRERRNPLDPENTDSDAESLPPPTGLTAIAGYKKVKLTWNPVTGAVKYIVYQNDKQIGTPENTYYEDTGLEGDHEYKYQVASVHSSGLGGRKSDPVYAVPKSSEFPDKRVASFNVSIWGYSPDMMCCHPNGNYLYVASGGKRAYVIRTGQNAVIDTIKGPDDYSMMCMTILPNGEYLYIGGYWDSDVLVVNTSTNQVIEKISIDHNIVDMVALPNGEYIYAAASCGRVYVIRTSDNSSVTYISVGAEPCGITVLPNGEYVYVANSGSNSVSVIRTSDNTLVKTISIDETYGLHDIAVLPNGEYVYVSGYWGTHCIRTSNNAIVATISNSYSGDIGVLPNGEFIYVGSSERGSGCDLVIRTSDNSIAKSLDTRSASIAILPNGEYAYMMSYADCIVVLGY